MSQYTLLKNIPQCDAGTIFTSDGPDWFWPDPTQVGIWDGTDFVKSEDTAIADLPDCYHYNTEYVVNATDWFELVV